MSMYSFVKELWRSFVFSLFRVLAVGTGIIVLFVCFSLLLRARTPQLPPRQTTPEVVANHRWQVAPLSPTAPTIIKVDIKGVIGTDSLTGDFIRTMLVESLDNEISRDQIKGVILEIDSPGGTVCDSDSIYNLILTYKKMLHVPVYAYVNGICASGGMYIACSADKVYASESSLVGHVGTLMGPIFNVSTLMDKIGVQSKTITAGTGKDDLNPFRPWGPKEGASFQNIADIYYDQFIGIVSKNRIKLTKEDLIEQGAQVYPALESQKLGYIDGCYPEVDNVLKKLSTDLGIDKNYQVVQLRRQNWLDGLFVEDAASHIFKGLKAGSIKMEHTIRVNGELHPDLQGKPLYLYHPQSK